MSKSRTMKPRAFLKRQALLEEGRAQGLAQGLSTFALERVAAAVGISKRTLYKYFGSRNAFIEALIVFDGDAWREWFFDAIKEQADAPDKRLLVFFETLSLWTASSDFEGCLFAQVICGSIAFPEDTHRIAQEQADHLRKFLHDHARKAGVKHSEQYAAALLPTTLLLLSGAGNHITDNPGQDLAKLARTLLHTDIPLDTL